MLWRLTPTLLLLASTSLWASGFDFGIGSQLQSFPKGVSIFSEAGLSAILWGQQRPDAYAYGFVRPALRASTSALLNKWEYKIDFYPMSLIGITAGSTFNERTATFAGEHCPSSLQCGGIIRRNYVSARLGFAIRRFFMMGQVEYVDLRPNFKNLAFWDDGSDLDARANADFVLNKEIVVGVDTNKFTKIGMIGTFGRMYGTNTYTDTEYAFVLVTRGDFQYAFAAGSFYSALHHRGLTVGFKLTFTPFPSPNVL